MRKQSTTIILILVILIISVGAAAYTRSSYSMLPITKNKPELRTESSTLTDTHEKSQNSLSTQQDSELSIPSTLNAVHISDARALDLYDKGLKLYYQRQFSEALELFNQALEIDALCYEALNAKGATLAFQGQHDQGLALIKQALDLNPAFVYANFNQGLAFELAGRWDEAIASYQNALKLDDKDTWSYYGIASIYGRQGNVDKVLEYLKLAIALEEDVREVARNEHDFFPVRHDPRFQALVKP